MAIKITNKRNLCTVENSDTSIKLSGEVTTESKKIISFSGTFYRVTPEEYIGNFGYSETSDDRISKNMDNIPSDLYEKANKLLDDSISEIKASEEI